MEGGLEFTVLFTNDLHSEFESMPRIRSLFRTYEREQPGRLLRFDIGDHMDRMRMETEGTMGAANIDIMNAMGYDAVVPGNNEGLTLTADVLDRLYGRQAAFPVLAANLVRRPRNGAGEWERVPWLLPRLVIARGGVRFGVFGVTAAFNDFYRELGWEALDPFATAAEQVKRLREEGADVIIALSHLGLNYDRRLAESVAGVDLILGGHTHHLLEKLERVGDTYIGAAGRSGSHIGVVRLLIDPAARRLVRCEGGAVETAPAPPDRETPAVLRRQAGAPRAALSRVVARLARPLPADPDGESALGNLLAMALRRHAAAEIGLVNAGQLLDGLPAGPVTAERLHAICPSPVNPCVMELQGAHLRQAIEESLLAERRRFSFRGFGFRGRVLGALLLDGMTVETESDGGGNGRAVAIRVGDEPLDDSRWYRVATIDMFTFRIGYPSLAEGRGIIYLLPEFLRDLLAGTLASPILDILIAEASRPCYIRTGKSLQDRSIIE